MGTKELAMHILTIKIKNTMADNNSLTVPSPISSDSFSSTQQEPFQKRSANSMSQLSPLDDGFIANLQERLSSSKTELKEWVQAQQNVCDDATSRYRKEKDKLQGEITSINQEIVTWKLEKECKISDNEEAASQENVLDEVEQNKQKEDSMTKLIKVLQENVNKHRADLNGELDTSGRNRVP